MDKDLEKTGENILKHMEQIVKLNSDGTYTVKMPQGIEPYIIKELTIREEQKAKQLATEEISKIDMCMLRSVKEPKISTDMWLDLPSKVKKRLEYVFRYLDGDFDFLG